MTTDYLTLIQPDDWHLHLRDETALANTVPFSARVFQRAIVMPNLKTPVTSVAAALAYRERICSAVPEGCNFEPLMTLYLTDNITTDEIVKAHYNEHVQALKYYPAGATTNSDSGVTSVEKIFPALEKMTELSIPLLVHGEVTDETVDIFDREAVFIDTVLQPVIERFPKLKIVLEHITTSQAVSFVSEQSEHIAATITVHHLLYNRSHLLARGVRPHFYCLPVLKRDSHQAALVAAAISGNPKFFLGTDSAPHTRVSKETDCGCAGVFSAPAALELYAEIFEKNNALDKLEGFASLFGPDFYQLPRNEMQIVLQKEPWEMPAEFQLGPESVVPINASGTINWRVSGDTA